jgi:hypothetical protein
MENNTKKSGCGIVGNRLKMVDPNDFLNEGINRNIPVPLEDLTIYVKLTSTRKGRTILIADSQTDSTSSESKKDLSISFLDGSNVNNKKSLTTRFTDLTTVFENNSNTETLGITNIDVDFNTAMVPAITIDFVDVRGSSIFQNENNILDNATENPYSVFFDFPYPLYELEIKGYYGYPVKYCLHMVKFNSKFNSQTGNFEIKAEFIGYTYAMLSDMLVGVLKGCELTTDGVNFLVDYNKTKDVPTLSIDEFKVKLANIQKEIDKAGQNSESAKVLKTFSLAKDFLDEIETTLNSFKPAFNKNVGDKDTTNFVIRFDNSPLSADETTVFNDKNDSIKKTIDNLNNLKINNGNFNLVYDNVKVGAIVQDLSKKIIDTTDDTQINGYSDKTSLYNFKKDLSDEINHDDLSLTDTTLFSVFDLRDQLSEVAKQKRIIESSLTTTNQDLAKEVKEIMETNFGFEPTIRNIIEIFTAAIETFMHVLYRVSKTAGPDNTNRQSELDKVFKNNKDSNDYINDTTYYPWPNYYEKSLSSQSYTEKYLGASTLIQTPNNIPEVKFINELLEKIILSLIHDKQIDDLTNKDKIFELPTNVLDTPLFSQKAGINPYVRGEGKDEIIDLEGVKRLITLRAITFLGFTNDETYLTKGDKGQIQEMAKNEAITIANGVKNDKIKQTLRNLNVDNILKANGKINDITTSVLKKVGDSYHYNYIVSDVDAQPKLLPVGYDLNGKSVFIKSEENTSQTNPYQPVYQPDMITFGKDNLFLTNYGVYAVGSGDKTIDNKLYNDGGIYIKMFTTTEYNAVQGTLNSNVTTDSKIVLENLTSNLQSAGFNPFGGKYGAQDFSTIDFGNGIPAETPARYVFYSNQDLVRVGLAYSREKTAISLTTPYDFNVKSNKNRAYNGMPYNIRHALYKKNGEEGQNHIHGSLGKNRLLATQVTDFTNVTFPYINQYMDLTNIDYFDSFSLFGSKWYYLQKNATATLNDNTSFNVENYAKALLFLNTLPFNIDYKKPDPFNIPEIKHLFDVNGGFVHAPRLWVAYVGGLLWWLSKKDPKIENGKITGGGRGKSDPIKWEKSCGNSSEWKAKPSDVNKYYYFPRELEHDSVEIDDNSLLFTLPYQVKDAFRKVFFDFVNGGLNGYTSFLDLKDSLEIYDGAPTSFCGIVDKFVTETADGGYLTKDGDKYYYDGINVKNNFKNYGNYKEIVPIDLVSYQSYSYKHIFLELKDGSNAVKKMLQAFDEELVIANTTYRIWKKPTTNDDYGYRTGIKVSSSVMTEYLNALVREIAEISKNGIQTQEEKVLKENFGSSNKNDIKLMLYKHCKNIYDKWLAGVYTEDNILYQCGEKTNSFSNLNHVDKGLSVKYKNTEPRLIDSFRFVTRSFKDIGDKMFVNPLNISNKISDSQNLSAYYIISDILTVNKFEFHALPSFINFYDEKMLKGMFTPFSEYDETIKLCGPSFVSVYTGQKSNQLDFNGSKYPNDGFDLRCENGILSTSIPDDFKTDLGVVESNGSQLIYEDPVTVFNVRYSQQNQNIFKDITLVQSEFSETEESLKIISDLADTNSQNQAKFAGQNMYNIYAVRSYSAEIEMLGNAMIQPLMYFQLDNIPMFHGAYMITRVKHNIKPNHMSTNFTGVRIRAIETPIFDIFMAYENLIDVLKMGENLTTSKNATVSGTFAPIIMTIRENGGVNGNPFSGNITNKPLNVKNIKGLVLDGNVDNNMVSEASSALELMCNDFIGWMKDNGFKGKNGTYLHIVSMYRSRADQDRLFKEYGKGRAATPGNSPHGWGIAIDFQFLNKNGDTIGNDMNPEYFKFEKNPAIKWLYDNSYKYGYFLPTWARNEDNKQEEFWHWEYYGKSAIKCWQANPNVYGYKVTNFDETKIRNISNPLTADKKEAVYNNCEESIVDTTKDNGLQINPKLIYTELKSKLQYPDDSIAGVMGNLYQESRFIPTARNPQGDYGLAQWTSVNGNTRQKNFFNYISANNLDSASYVDQITYLKHELITYDKTDQSMKTQKTASDAARIWFLTFERTNYGQVGWTEAKLKPYENDKSLPKRINFAKEFSTMIKNNKYYFPK